MNNKQTVTGTPAGGNGIPAGENDLVIVSESVSSSSEKLAFAMINRPISENNVKAKMKSIKSNGLLTAIQYVEASLYPDNDIIDAVTKELISADERDNYRIIVDGQHRFEAITRLNKEYLQKKDEKNKKGEPLCPSINSYECRLEEFKAQKELSLEIILSELNNTSVAWSNADYVSSLKELIKGEDVLDFITEFTSLKSKVSNDGLPKNGYPLATISLFLTGNKRINKKAIVDLTKGSKVDILRVTPEAIEEAGALILAMRRAGFPDEYIAKRYLIEKVNYYRFSEKESTRIPVDDIIKAFGMFKLGSDTESGIPDFRVMMTPDSFDKGNPLQKYLEQINSKAKLPKGQEPQMEGEVEIEPEKK